MSLAIRDSLSPELLRKARAIADRRPILEAMALQLVSFTKRAFSDPALRAAPWRPRKDTKPHPLLRKSSDLWKSFAIETTNDHATVSSNKVYAAAQQFGYAPRNLPARPFFPFATPTSDMLPAAQQKIRNVAAAKIKAIIGAT